MSALTPEACPVGDSDRTEQVQPTGEPSMVEPEAPTRTPVAQDSALALLEAIVRELRLLRDLVACCHHGRVIADLGRGVELTHLAALGVLNAAGDGEPQ
jgi:hypothetical protein